MNDCKSEVNTSTQHNLPNQKYLIIPILLGVLTLCALNAAVWQWQRSQYHEALLLVALQNQANPHTPVDLNFSHNTPRLGEPISIQGRWLSASTTYVSPRLLAGQLGAWPISVFEYADWQGQNQYIAVQRGWTAQTQPNIIPVLPNLSQNLVQLRGELVANLPKAFELQAVNNKHLGLWQNYDSTAHAKLINHSLPSYILVLSPDSPDAEVGLLKRLAPQQTSELLAQKAAKNRGYAVQWLGLFLVGVLGLIWMWRGRLK